MSNDLTNYEKALLKIEIMKLKEHEINIGNCNASDTEKKVIEKEIEKTKDYIEKILKG